MSQIDKKSLPALPNTKVEARKAVRAVRKLIGNGYHPDTPGDDYVYSTDAKPDVMRRTFTKAGAAWYDAIHERAFRLLGDEVYDYDGPADHAYKAFMKQVAAKARKKR